MVPHPKPEDAAPVDSMGFLNLGKGWIPLEYLLMVKCLDPQGQVKYREMSSKTLHPVEALGMLSTMGDTLRNRLMRDARNFRDDE
jgi:hypothetical protein